jgi:hypothetical protein
MGAYMVWSPAIMALLIGLAFALMARFDKAQDVLAWAYNLAALACIIAAATWVIGVVFAHWYFGVGNYGDGAWFG